MLVSDITVNISLKYDRKKLASNITINVSFKYDSKYSRCSSSK